MKPSIVHEILECVTKHQQTTAELKGFVKQATRHGTVEKIASRFEILPDNRSATRGRHILAGKQSTKHMDAQASADYSKAIELQLDRVRGLLADDPHTRKAVIQGPIGACWLSTQVLSNPDDTYTLIANYRSMDIEHYDEDADIQAAIGHAMVDGRITRFIFNVGSLHKYK